MANSKTKQKENGRVTLANVIAVVGLAIWGVFSFFGEMYLNGGAAGLGVFWTMLAVIFPTAFLLLMLKAKQTKNDFKLWRIVEFVALVVYVLMALFFSNSFLQFFNVSSQKEELKTLAIQEIDQVSGLYNEYEKWKVNALSQTEQQLINAVTSGGNRSIELNEYMKKKSIGNTPSGVTTWIKEIVTPLFNMKRNDELITTYKTQIITWDMMNIAQVSGEIKKLGEDVQASLNQKIEQNRVKSELLPQVVRGDDGKYVLNGFKKKQFSYRSSGEFNRRITEPSSTTTGWFLLIVLHLLILLNYFAVPRSITITPTKGSTIGGRPIGE